MPQSQATCTRASTRRTPAKPAWSGRAKMQEKGRELLGDNAKGLEEFYTERADALVLAGNRLSESRTRPLRVLDGSYDLDDALQDRQVCVVHVCRACVRVSRGESL